MSELEKVFNKSVLKELNNVSWERFMESREGVNEYTLLHDWWRNTTPMLKDRISEDMYPIVVRENEESLTLNFVSLESPGHVKFPVKSKLTNYYEGDVFDLTPYITSYPRISNLAGNKAIHHELSIRYHPLDEDVIKSIYPIEFVLLPFESDESIERGFYEVNDELDLLMKPGIDGRPCLVGNETFGHFHLLDSNSDIRGTILDLNNEVAWLGCDKTLNTYTGEMTDTLSYYVVDDPDEIRSISNKKNIHEVSSIIPVTQDHLHSLKNFKIGEYIKLFNTDLNCKVSDIYLEHNYDLEDLSKEGAEYMSLVPVKNTTVDSKLREGTGYVTLYYIMSPEASRLMDLKNRFQEMHPEHPTSIMESKYPNVRWDKGNFSGKNTLLLSGRDVVTKEEISVSLKLSEEETNQLLSFFRNPNVSGEEECQ